LIWLSGIDVREKLARHRQLLNARLGLDVALRIGMDMSEIFSTEDLTVCLEPDVTRHDPVRVSGALVGGKEADAEQPLVQEHLQSFTSFGLCAVHVNVRDCPTQFKINTEFFVTLYIFHLLATWYFVICIESDKKFGVKQYIAFGINIGNTQAI
jgi:hypothetical protein